MDLGINSLADFLSAGLLLCLIAMGVTGIGCIYEGIERSMGKVRKRILKDRFGYGIVGCRPTIDQLIELDRRENQ